MTPALIIVALLCGVTFGSSQPKYTFFDSRMIVAPATDVARPPKLAVEPSAQPVSVVSNYEQAVAWYRLYPDCQHDDVFITRMAELQSPSYCDKVGSTPGAIADQVFAVFTKYGIPLGMLGRFTALQRDYCDAIVIILDDSRRMRIVVRDPDLHIPGVKLHATRWDLACRHVLALVEIVAYLDRPPIHLHFLERASDEVVLQRSPSESAAEFAARATAEISAISERRPQGWARWSHQISKVLEQYRGRHVAHYWFGSIRHEFLGICPIRRSIRERHLPYRQSITMVSCSSIMPSWLTDMPRRTPHFATIDRFADERYEVERNQGKAFPYGYGLHLSRIMLAATNPKDVGALNGPFPMTKFTMESLLGLKQRYIDYRLYYIGVMAAQRKHGRIDMSSLDTHDSFNRFCSALHSASRLSEVQRLEQEIRCAQFLDHVLTWI